MVASDVLRPRRLSTSSSVIALRPVPGQQRAPNPRITTASIKLQPALLGLATHPNYHGSSLLESTHTSVVVSGHGAVSHCRVNAAPIVYLTLQHRLVQRLLYWDILLHILMDCHDGVLDIGAYNHRLLRQLVSIQLQHQLQGLKKPPCPSRLTRSSAASVTILRPLKGIDCNLEQNLESSFLQDYPNFEIIFCIASDKDPCIPIVRKLAAKHRHISCDVNVGVNPKVNNLSRGYSMAKSDIVWILDSNVQMNHGALGRAVDLLTEPGVGLVIHLPCGVRPLSFGSLLDAVFLNSTHARMFSAINRLNVVSCVVGKSNLFRRSDLVDYGGLDGFGRYMSEDNMIGAALMVKGYRHRVAPDLAYQSLGYSTLKDYFSRRARWIRIRKYVVAVATMYEPFSESLIAGLTAGWAFQYTLGVPFWPFFILNMVAWFASDAFVVWVIHPDSVRGSGWTDFCLFALAWLARELSAIPVYIWAMSGSTVEWRGAVLSTY
ncbi:hypothetical protein BSLG_009684 [Batrachochytrium salamandrivorans]|nr:hypothetical protein BSLG_009684 [Batrachochytrium salamandrivorans]